MPPRNSAVVGGFGKEGRQTRIDCLSPRFAAQRMALIAFMNDPLQAPIDATDVALFVLIDTLLSI
jgi:hypothetical protein